jgi:hypothetical protein
MGFNDAVSSLYGEVTWGNCKRRGRGLISSAISKCAGHTKEKDDTSQLGQPVYRPGIKPNTYEYHKEVLLLELTRALAERSNLV